MKICKCCNLVYIYQSYHVLFCVGVGCVGVAYALYILNNRYEYGTLTDTMKLIKHVTNPKMLFPYEQFFIHDYHIYKHLIPEQHINDINPLYQTILDIYDTSLTYKQKINTSP